MAIKFYNPAVVGQVEQVLGFVGNHFESSTGSSVTGKDRDGKTRLRNEGVRQLSAQVSRTNAHAPQTTPS